MQIWQCLAIFDRVYGWSKAQFCVVWQSSVLELGTGSYSLVEFSFGVRHSLAVFCWSEPKFSIVLQSPFLS